MPFTPALSRRLLWAGIIFGLVCGLAWFWWQCDRNPEIRFLAEHGNAQWIIYPKPPVSAAWPDFEICTVFRRKFQLERSPEIATLSLRAFTNFQVSVNGMAITNAARSESNWKDPTELNLAGNLRAGLNDISITVLNRKAPPALWASLRTTTDNIVSGPEWDASMLGATWQPAQPAAIPVKLAPGNPLFTGENTYQSLNNSLPVLSFFALIASGVVYLISRSVKRLATQSAVERTHYFSRLTFCFLAGLVVLWAALFFNNMRSLPHDIGFDEDAHEEYINYIRTNHALPLANQGWEMCQPPLYYTIGAGLEATSGAQVNSQGAATVLRLFGLLTGVTHVVLIFLSLKLLFPQNLGAQWFGVIVAAFLPEHLYISQYITNEFLAAAFVSGALYGCLRLLKLERESWKLALAIGSCLGCALLTKFTPVLSFPFIAGVLIFRAAENRAQLRARLQTLAIIFATAFVVAGWHYIRVWIHFGRPVVHDWDPVSGFSWWSDNGFQTASYFTHFGECLLRPYYSVVHGFGDGIYSSMWGDAYFGGVRNWENRPAWNYDLMTAGFVLALLPTLVILTGLAIGIFRFLKQPRSVWFLMLGLLVTTYAALVFMSLKLPYFCNVKSFYALMTLLPVCALGALGWEKLTRVLGKFSPAIYVLMLIWAMNAYASFWILGGGAATHVMRGNLYRRTNRLTEATAELTEALRINPHEILARRFLAAQHASAGQSDAAKQELQTLLTDDPDNADGLLQAAYLLAATGNPDQALKVATRITEVAPDYPLVYPKLATLLQQKGATTEAISAVREGLRVSPFTADLHLRLAALLTASTRNEPDEIAQQFKIVRDLQPDWPESIAHDRLGMALAQQQTWAEATRQFAEAARLEPDQPLFYSHLAQSHAQVGHFDEAITAANRAISAAQAKGDNEAIAANQRLIELCGAQKSSGTDTGIPH